MNDSPIQKIAVYLGGVCSFAAVTAVFAMWNQLNRLEAEEPLREQLRAFELEQLRQGMQLNSNELDVQKMLLDDIEDRVGFLERAP